MFIALNREALKAPLPDMSAAAIMLVITTHMARQQPLHELTQRSLVRRFENEVKVIGHQAETKQLNSLSFLRVSQERKKRFVVLSLVEYRGAAIAAINNVVDVAALLSSWNSRHAALLTYSHLSFQ